MVAALEKWPRSGVPENPGAWLMATARNQAIHTLSPCPSAPTLFIPSFQSPVPISGRPCGPNRLACSIARTQCAARSSTREDCPGSS